MALGTRAAGVTSRSKKMPPVPPRMHFIRKMLRSTSIALGVIGGGLIIGMGGYHWFGKMSWLEAFYYASMILAGEGPPADPASLTGAQISHLHLFAGFYALFSGVTFITMAGVLFAPALHRFLHRFHLELSTYDDDSKGRGRS